MNNLIERMIFQEASTAEINEAINAIRGIKTYTNILRDLDKKYEERTSDYIPHIKHVHYRSYNDKEETC